jgi:hypothetical protein
MHILLVYTRVRSSVLSLGNSIHASAEGEGAGTNIASELRAGCGSLSGVQAESDEYAC